jgi:hypothetical protein
MGINAHISRSAREAFVLAVRDVLARLRINVLLGKTEVYWLKNEWHRIYQANKDVKQHISSRGSFITYSTGFKESFERCGRKKNLKAAYQ